MLIIMKTIIVTGSNGLLGQKLTEIILKRECYHLVATSRGQNRFPLTKGYEYVEMDVLDTENVKNVVEKYQPHAIIHTAAMTNVDTCHIDKEGAYALNVTAVKTLVDICEKNNVQLIHLSTDFIFDGEAGPYAEDAKPNPVSYYGETKLMGEEVVQQSKCDWAILRTILVYGITSDMSRSNIVLWAKGALEKNSPINVVNDQFRMPTLAEDLAQACLLAVDKNAEGIYHISGKDYLNIAQIVNRVADFWSLDKTLITEVSSEGLSQDAKRPMKTGFVLDKAINELGYQPHSFEEGLSIVAQQLKLRG
jgi:dTDP-4-dehydrorhamnose reductase